MRRETLTANRTYYVRKDGSDSNNGSTNDASNAFLTIQKALSTILNYLDTNGFATTINVGPGTYTENITINQSPVGSGQINFIGDITTPDNVVISPPSGLAFLIQYCPSPVIIRGFKITTTSTGIQVHRHSYAQIGNSGVLTGLANGSTTYFPGSSAGSNLYGSQYV